MAVRVLEKARLSEPADGRVKREVHQHSAYAPVAQWIEHQPTDLGVGDSSPSGRTTKSKCYVGQPGSSSDHVEAV